MVRVRARVRARVICTPRSRMRLTQASLLQSSMCSEFQKPSFCLMLSTGPLRWEPLAVTDLAGLGLRFRVRVTVFTWHETRWRPLTSLWRASIHSGTLRTARMGSTRWHKVRTLLNFMMNTHTHTHTHTDRQTDSQADRQTNGHTDSGFRVSGVGCRVSGVGFRVSGVGCRVSGVGFRVSGVGFRVDTETFHRRIALKPGHAIVHC